MKARLSFAIGCLWSFVACSSEPASEPAKQEAVAPNKPAPPDAGIVVVSEYATLFDTPTAPPQKVGPNFGMEGVWAATNASFDVRFWIRRDSRTDMTLTKGTMVIAARCRSGEIVGTQVAVDFSFLELSVNEFKKAAGQSCQFQIAPSQSVLCKEDSRGPCYWFGGNPSNTWSFAPEALPFTTPNGGLPTSYTKIRDE